MNVFYGVLGFSGCCFFDLCLVLFIILCGYWIMCCICELIEVEGYMVIYGDIDFIFVWFGSFCVEEEVVVIGWVLVVWVNDWWCEYLKEEFGFDSVFEL